MKFLTVISLLFIPLLSFPQSGKVLVAGGGSESDTSPESWSTVAYSWAVNQSANKKVAVIHYESTGTFLKPYFISKCGAVAAENFVINSSNANNAAVMDQLKQYDVFFFRGGDQYQYYIAYNGTLMEQTMKEKFSQGGVLAGTSAGLAILSGVSYIASGSSAVSDVCIKNINHSSITLATDFMPFYPDYLFDSHFLNRGRMGRLIAFMANFNKEERERIIGIGVDENTAFGISADHKGFAFGTGAVNIYRLPDNNEYGEGPLLQARDITVTQMVHGDTIDLLTWQNNGFSELLIPAVTEETRNSVLYLSGSDFAGSANTAMLNLFVQDGNGLSDPILIITGSSTSMAEQFRNVMLQLGASNVQIHQGIYSMPEDAALTTAIENASKILFVGNTTYNLGVFLENNQNGTLLKQKLALPGFISAYIGDNARLAGPWQVGNYLSPTGSSSAGLTFSPGLGLLSTTVIIPKTFESPSGSTDIWQTTHAAVPYTMVVKNLANGIWLNNENFLVYTPGKLKVYGNSPVMFMKNEGTRAGLVSRTHNQLPGEKARMIAGFDAMKLSFLTETEEITLGTVNSVPLPQPSSNSLSLFPNPAYDQINISLPDQSSDLGIYDITGKQMAAYKNISGNFNVSLGAYPPGVYLVKASASGKKMIAKLIIANKP